MPDALLAHLAPLGWQHINLTGDYLWGADGRPRPGRVPATAERHPASRSGRIVFTLHSAKRESSIRPMA